MEAKDVSKHLVRAILENATKWKWQVQGFGMFRLYLSKSVRLHVWDPRFRVADVSDIHDHPWDFTSVVIAGKLLQHRYVDHEGDLGDPWMSARIKCGAGACLVGEATSRKLMRGPDEVYEEGESYFQASSEIHESLPEPGTVTVIERVFHPDTEHATVIFPVGKSWVSAEPRAASEGEVQAMAELSLSRWFQ